VLPTLCTALSVPRRDSPAARGNSCNFTAPIALLAVCSKGPSGSLTVGLLDIGSGLGGPSRYLAANYGCRVIGIDITEEYCRLASVLAARMGLEGRVEYRHGDARVLLFPDETFDGAEKSGGFNQEFVKELVLGKSYLLHFPNETPRICSGFFPTICVCC